jgi:flagellar basal body-associated protein FliL
LIEKPPGAGTERRRGVYGIIRMSAVVSLIVFLSLLLLVGLAVVFAVRKREEIEREGDAVIKNIYVYLVLFATLMMTIGGTVSAFMAVADMVAPTPYYQTFEEFKLNNRDVKSALENETPAPVLSEDEMRDKYNAIVAGERNRQVERAKNSLIKSLGWIIIPLPVFIYFQRRLTAGEEFTRG